MTKTLSKTSGPVDVAAAMRAADTNVFTQAKERFDAALVTYREGIRRLAATGGTLPPDEAEVLLRAARDLEVPAERLDADMVTIMRHGRAASVIAEIDARNHEQGERAARLRAIHEDEKAKWLVVKRECDQRLAAALERYDAAQRQLDQAERQPMERADDQHAECRRHEDSAPHLFRSVDPDQLRRIVRPQSRSLYP